MRTVPELRSCCLETVACSRVRYTANLVVPSLGNSPGDSSWDQVSRMSHLNAPLRQSIKQLILPCRMIHYTYSTAKWILMFKYVEYLAYHVTPSISYK